MNDAKHLHGHPVHPSPPKPPENDPIGLVEDLADDTPAESKIKAFGVGLRADSKQWSRQTNRTGTGAVRVKTFHGKLSDQGMGYLDDAVNEWLDRHPEVEVKFVTSSVGIFEGKIRDPALILNVWY